MAWHKHWTLWNLTRFHFRNEEHPLFEINYKPSDEGSLMCFLGDPQWMMDVRIWKPLTSPRVNLYETFVGFSHSWMSSPVHSCFLLVFLGIDPWSIATTPSLKHSESLPSLIANLQRPLTQLSPTSNLVDMVLGLSGWGSQSDGGNKGWSIQARTPCSVCVAEGAK